MDSLMLNLTNNSGLWESVLNWLFSFLGNVGWCVVILTILIKLLLSPLEFWQKKGMKKMTAALTLMQPEMEKIKAKCGNNQQLYNQKMQELYKKHNVNPAGGCAPMLVYMILSSVVFITFFSCLSNVSYEQTTNQYKNLENVYSVAYNYYKDEEPVELNGVKYKITEEQKALVTNNSDYELLISDYEAAAEDSLIKQNYTSAESYALEKRLETLSQLAVVNGITLYEEEDGTDTIFLNGFTQEKQGFLWIKNIWRSDNYNSVFPSAEDYIKSSKISFSLKDYVIDESLKDSYKNANGESLVTEKDGVYTVKGYYQNLDGTVVIESEAKAKEAFISTYNTVTNQINNVYDGWNGYFILVILVAALTLFSSKLTNFGSKTRDKKGFEVDVKPQKQNKVMMIVLTGLFVWITWSYTAAFALYIVISSLIGIPLAIIMNLLINAVEKKERVKDEISYSRYKN